MAAMSTKGLTAWGARYGLTLAQVRDLQRLDRRFTRQETAVCNGDPHPRVEDREDKNANARAWREDREQTAAALRALARDCGFDAVDFRAGVSPTFHKGEERFITVPE